MPSKLGGKLGKNDERRKQKEVKWSLNGASVNVTVVGQSHMKTYDFLLLHC